MRESAPRSIRTARLQAVSAPSDEHRRRVAAAVAALAGGIAASQSALDRDPVPQHTSILRGRTWVCELLAGNAARMQNNLGMNTHVFLRLLHALEEKAGLRDSRHISKEEKLAILLYALVTNCTNRKLAERFQRSGDTISRVIHSVIDTVLAPAFYHAYVKPPDANSVAERIRSDPKFYPYFKDCIGAIDGCHKPVSAPADVSDCYHNRKGFVSINFLAAIDFNMSFVYALSGWEGSATDSTVYDDARRRDFSIPQGKLFLADGGYPMDRSLLIPFRGERYHLREWAAGNTRPRNARELFNLRHSQLRNIIERGFGVVKRRFAMMRESSYFPLELQAKSVLVMLVFHNFILFHDPHDAAEDDDDSDETLPMVDESAAVHALLGGGSRGAEEADARREAIAQAMWEDYERHRAR